MRALGGNEERANELLANFWERQVAKAEGAEMRDRALIYQLRTLEQRTATREARAGALVGGDYPLLVSGIRPGSHIDGLGIDAAGAVAVTLTDGHIVQTWDAETGQSLGSAGGFPALAEEFVTIRRRVNIETAGSVRDPVVAIDLRHPQATDVRGRPFRASGQPADQEAAARTRDDVYIQFTYGPGAERPARGEGPGYVDARGR